MEQDKDQQKDIGLFFSRKSKKNEDMPFISFCIVKFIVCLLQFAVFLDPCFQPAFYGLASSVKTNDSAFRNSVVVLVSYTFTLVVYDT